MKLEGVIFGFLLCLFALAYYQDDSSSDKAIAEKVAIIENAKNSDNPAVIASGKNAEIELKALQQKKAEAVRAEQAKIAGANHPKTSQEPMTSHLGALLVIALSVFIAFKALIAFKMR